MAHKPSSKTGIPPSSKGVYVCPNCLDSHSPDFAAETSICNRCLFAFALQTPVPDESSVMIAGATRSLQNIPNFGSYTVLEEIGRGGMGIIYRAVHRDTGETVALKSILPQHTECAETVARFRREAEAATCLVHPHSMPVHEVGYGAGGVPFFTMKLAEGGNLHQLAGKYRGRWRQIADLMIKISGAIQHAHDRGILHRDLKPSNILFTEDQEPLVTDFGLSKRITGSDDLTQSCSILGTPNYIAPEQAAGRTRDVGPSTDIWGVGTIFYELLTGRPPFVGDNPLDVLRQVTEHSPVRPKRLSRSIPDTLETICMRCLETWPEDRYSSTREFAHDLESWLQGRKIAARPLRIRLRRGYRTRRMLTALCIGTIVGTLALALGLAWTLTRKPPAGQGETVSIAVAVENLNGDEPLQQFARLSASTIQTGLARTDGFRVFFERHADSLPVSEVFNPVSYGREKNVQTVLAGTIRRAEGNLRLVLRLIRSDTGEVIWRCGKNIIADQVNVELPKVCDELVQVLRMRWQTNPSAFAQISSASAQPDAVVFYTRGKELASHSNRADLEDAMGLFRRSIELDPHFAPPRSLLAYSLWACACVWGDTDKLPLAISAAQNALSIDPDSAEAHRALAGCHFKYAQYKEALDEFWKALEIIPQSASCNVSLGICLREMGHPDQAIPWLERSVKLDPVHASFNNSLGETLSLLGSDARAEAALNHASELNPDQPDTLVSLSVLRLWQKQFEQARHLCAEINRRFSDYRYASSVTALIEFFSGEATAARTHFEDLRARHCYEQSWECFGAINPASALAYLAKQAGETEQSRTLAMEAFETDYQLLKKYPHNSRVLHDLAATAAVMDDDQHAMEYLTEALADGWVEHRSTMLDPRFSMLINNQTFVALLNNTFPKPPVGSVFESGFAGKSALNPIPAPPSKDQIY